MKTFKHILTTIIFLIVLGVCIAASVIVLQRKDSLYKYSDFFDKAKEGQIDVLFIGSSHVINAENPAVLYEDYGITSYNMGGHGSVLQATYWELMEALRYCTPKYVVVDTFMMEKDYKYLDVLDEESGEDDINTSIEQLHLNMDAWPLTRMKIDAINDLILDREIKRAFLLDFTTYHQRWDELDKNDFKKLVGTEERNNLFGAEMRYDIELEPVSHPDPEPGERLSDPTVGTTYLAMIIEECQKRGIGVIVTFLPCCASTTDKKVANTAGYIAEQYDVPFINFLELDVTDINTDMNDTGHVNAIGSVKITDYVGSVLAATGEFTDHRGEAAYEDWQQKSDAFFDKLHRMSSESDTLYQMVNYLDIDNVSSVIYINDGSEAFEDNILKNLLGNISKTSKIFNTTGPYILINDAASGKIYEACEDEQIIGAKTALGTLNYIPVEHLFRFLYTD